MNTQKETLRGLQEVKVAKEKLLEAIQENKIKHAQQFDEAHAGWKVTVLKEVQDELKRQKKLYRNYIKSQKKMMREIESRISRMENGDFTTDRASFYAKKPEHHIEDYNSAIKKLSMSLDEQFELNEQDFEKFVMDNWSWKTDFKNSHTGFSNAYSIYNSTIDGPVGGSIPLITTGSISTSLIDGTYVTSGSFLGL